MRKIGGCAPYDGSMGRNRRGRPRHPDVLTPAEWRVLDALREGGTNAEIAARLGLSPDTVKTHISNMLAKLELRDRRALAAWRPDARPRRLGALFAVPAALADVARPLMWVGAGVATLAGVLVVAVALVALEAIVEGNGEPPAAVRPPAATPTATLKPAAKSTTPQVAANITIELRIAALHRGGLLQLRLHQRDASRNWLEYPARAEWSFYPGNHEEYTWFTTPAQAVTRPRADAWPVMVRAAARRLPGNLIELALQKFEPGGGWGSRYLPGSWLFPLDTQLEQWQATSALHISVPRPSGNQTVSPDRAALAALFVATGGASWKENTNWIGERPIGEWHGVTTNENGRVTALELPRNRLRGALPMELGGLSYLRTLDLSDNWLTGRIPAGLGRLSFLEWVDFSARGSWGGLVGDGPRCGGGLVGRIPAELGRLANLRHIALSCNSLSGTVPSELGSLINLETLKLDDNNLEGPLPAELAGLASLRTLNVEENQLSGSIPPEVGSLINLELLSLARNELSGPIPPELSNLTHLTELWLGDNALSGSLPPSLGSLANLRELHLGFNELTGHIPAELGSLGNLEGLVLHYNQLSGPIPAVLGRLQHLELLDLSANRLSGPIPPELGNLERLLSINLSGNRLTGCLSEQLSDVRFMRFDPQNPIC